MTATSENPSASDRPWLSIVVPTYREAENITELLRRIRNALDPLNRPYEVILVDDDSQDGTDDVVAELARYGTPIRLIARVGERGLSSAVLRGFDEAHGENLLCMDADLSHPPEAIAQLIETLCEDETDFVIGSRYVPGASTDEKWGMLRWINSKVATWLARPFTKVKDPMAGFFALRSESYHAADALNPIGYKVGLELMVKCRCRHVREVPIHFADRLHGQSKLNFAEQLKYLRHLRRLSDYKFGWFSKFVQFCFVGFSGLPIDLGSYALMLHGQVSVWLARAIAIWLAMTWNFALHYHVTFKDGRGSNPLLQYAHFCASCGFGAALSWASSVLLTWYVDFFAQHRLMAALVGIFVGLAFNFLLTHLWVFGKKKPVDQRRQK